MRLTEKDTEEASIKKINHKKKYSAKILRNNFLYQTLNTIKV